MVDGTGWEAASRAATLLNAHGANRARLLNYSLEQVIQEYRLLRETIMQALAVDPRMDQNTWSTIHSAMDYGMGQAAIPYTQTSQTEFVALVAHELRTPLSAISNALYRLENIRISDESADQTEFIVRLPLAPGNAAEQPGAG